MYFSIKTEESNPNFFFFIILNSIYFEAIQTAGITRKKVYTIVRPDFLMDLKVSCDQNKIKA